MTMVSFESVAHYFMLAVILVSLSLGGPAGSSDGEHAQKIVVHLTKSERDAHAAILAVKVAEELQSQGAEVTLYLDLEGVQLVDVRRERDGLWATSGPLPKHYEGLLAAGGKVLVSAEDARRAGLGQADLRKGAHIATPAEVAQALLSADKIIDY